MWACVRPHACRGSCCSPFPLPSTRLAMQLPPDVSLQLAKFTKAVEALTSSSKSLLAAKPFSEPSQPKGAAAAASRRASRSAASAAAALTGNAEAAAAPSTSGGPAAEGTEATPLQRARAHLRLAQAVHGLTSLLLKAQGQRSVGESRLGAELTRLAAYTKKVSSAACMRDAACSHGGVHEPSMGRLNSIARPAMRRHAVPC